MVVAPDPGALHIIVVVVVVLMLNELISASKNDTLMPAYQS